MPGPVRVVMRAQAARPRPDAANCAPHSSPSAREGTWSPTQRAGHSRRRQDPSPSDKRPGCHKAGPHNGKRTVQRPRTVLPQLVASPSRVKATGSAQVFQWRSSCSWRPTPRPNRHKPPGCCPSRHPSDPVRVAIAVRLTSSGLPSPPTRTTSHPPPPAPQPGRQQSPMHPTHPEHATRLRRRRVQSKFPFTELAPQSASLRPGAARNPARQHASTRAAAPRAAPLPTQPSYQSSTATPSRACRPRSSQQPGRACLHPPCPYGRLSGPCSRHPRRRTSGPALSGPARPVLSRASECRHRRRA